MEYVWYDSPILKSNTNLKSVFVFFCLVIAAVVGTIGAGKQSQSRCVV